MPTYRVTIAGKTYTVDIPNPHARPVQAIVDGEVIEVTVEDTAQTGTLPASMPVAAAPVLAPAPVVVPAPMRTASPIGTGGGKKVTAPLPGTVVSIDVKEGQAVEHGQELCILEAMKMNNPIRATQAGTVTEIFIHIGEQVQHGAPLMRIE